MQNKKTLIIIAAPVVVVIVAVFMFTQRVQYLEEFSYLPALKNMKAESYEEAEGDGFANAIYKIADEDYEDFLEEYEEILLKDGWEIAEENKPENLEATKDDHIARINVVDSNEELMILIWAK